MGNASAFAELPWGNPAPRQWFGLSPRPPPTSSVADPSAITFTLAARPICPSVPKVPN